MGCTASKLDNEDTVRRCKDRRRLIKEAVYARHHLASAHSDYCRSLRLTGSALLSFAAGEPLSVSDQTPAVILHPPPPPPSSSSTASAAIPTPRSFVPPSPSPSLHPPPPPPAFCPPSPTITSSKLPHILSDSSDNHRRRRKSSSKLPHILSESSPSGSPTSQRSGFTTDYDFRHYPTAYQNSTYSSTPSQASSMWNWENFYPPSPPDSEYFARKANKGNSPHDNNSSYQLDTGEDGDIENEETETERSEYDFFNPQKRYSDPGAYNNSAKHYDVKSKDGTIHEEAEREEVHCSEWGDHDHYSTTSSSGNDDEEEIETRSEMHTRHSVKEEKEKEEVEKSMPRTYGGSVKSEKSDGAGSSRSFRTGEISDMRMVVRHKDLKEIVEAIKDNFEKAASAGDSVSEMLEIGRAQLDRSFKQLKSECLLIQFL